MPEKLTVLRASDREAAGLCSQKSVVPRARYRRDVVQSLWPVDAGHKCRKLEG
jgi:hypothetical protein